MDEESKVAMWSVSKNRLVGDQELKVIPTKQEGMFVTIISQQLVPVWAIDRCLDLDLNERDDYDEDEDEEDFYEYVWFVE